MKLETLILPGSGWDICLVLQLSGSRPIHLTRLLHNPCPSCVTLGLLFLPKDHFQPPEKPGNSESVKAEPEARDFGKSVGSAGGGWKAGVMWDQGTFR